MAAMRRKKKKIQLEALGRLLKTIKTNKENKSEKLNKWKLKASAKI